MIRLIVKLLCLFILSAGNINAGVPDTTYKTMKDTALFAGLLKSYNAGLKSIESDFVQYKIMQILNNAVKSEGYFCYKNETMVRWEYTAPFSYLIIINDGKIIVKDGEKCNAYDFTASESFNNLSSLLGKILKGEVLHDNKNFTCRFYENEITYKLILTPRPGEIKDYFREIVLFFDKKMFSVSRVQINEVSGDVTDIWFNNRKINGVLSDEQFLIK